MPQDDYIDRLKGLAQMLLKHNMKKHRMINFEVDLNVRDDAFDGWGWTDNDGKGGTDNGLRLVIF